MTSRRLHRIACLVLLASSLIVTIGATPSHAGKKKRTVLSTEYDDARVGAESAQGVAAQMGVMDDPALNAYVSEIGNRLLRGVPRRGFDYQFSVVDQTEPNAFALPGGYIFVSRGLLALANSEDELACVIGHEIIHANHRHAATQQGLAKRSMGFGFFKAKQMAAYGRDMERDADKNGQLLCAAAGYDPMALSTFLRSLGQAERLQLGYARGHGWFDSHPGSTERAAANAVRAKEIRWRPDPKRGDTRKRLLSHIDGLPVGQRPETGIFQGDTFLQPDMDFQLRFPPGWEKINTNMAVGAVEKRGDAVVFLKAEMPEGEAEKMAYQWFDKASEEQKLKLKESKPVKIGKIQAWRMKIEASDRGGRVASYLTFVPYHGVTFSITGMCLAQHEKRYLGSTLMTARTFAPLSQQERDSIRSERLRFVTARPGESLEDLGRRANSAWHPSDAAIYNDVFVDHRFKGGEQVKVALSEPYVAAREKR